MKVYSQLEVASLENLASDPALLPSGRLWVNTTDLVPKVYDGATVLALMSQKKAVFGTNGTASNNIRLHRAGAAYLQLVPASDVTSEGSVSTTLAQVGLRHEVYTDGTKPAAGNAGRVVFLSDLQVFMGDNGASWASLGGGGGGGALQWVEDVESPTPLIENKLQVYSYGQGLAQKLYAMIRVPDSYTVGRQLKIKLGVYCGDSSGTALIQTVATLIRKGTDAVTSTTNQRTSSNTALTLSGGTVNVAQEIACDLSDASGAINSVAVAKGDFILVQLTRGTDTATGDVKAMVYGAEVLLA